MKQRRIIVVWVGLAAVVVCVALLIRQSHTEQQMRREAIAAHHADVAKCLELGGKMDDRILEARRGTGITRAEFAKQFGEISACSPQTHVEAPPDTTHVFTHEPSHRMFYLRFNGDVLARISSTHGPDDIQPHLPSIEQRIAQME